MLEITIPVLNEAKTLKKNILIILNYVKAELKTECRIVIADNGSSDETETIGRKLAENFNEIVFIKVPEKGVGLALKTSWLQSQAEIIGYMDLDLATDLRHLKEALDLMTLKNVEIVNGSRLLSDSKVYHRSGVRSLTSRIFNILVRKLLNVNLTDGMCGFKFFKRKIAVTLINQGIDTKGWFFSTEILVKAFWYGYQVKEIPIIWSDNSDSKVKIIKLSLEYIKEIIRLRKEKRGFYQNRI